MHSEHSQVALAEPVPALGLEVGDVGTVVHVHADGAAYEVEFTTFEGRTIGVETLEARQLRRIAVGAIPHERVPAAA